MNVQISVDDSAAPKPELLSPRTQGSTRVHFLAQEKRDGVIYYRIACNHAGSYWEVSRRFSAFLSLHQQLGDSRPFPRKFVLCRTEAFLESRWVQLEKWLCGTAESYGCEWGPLADFLDAPVATLQRTRSDASTAASSDDEEVRAEVSTPTTPSAMPLTAWQLRRAEMKREREASHSTAMDKATAEALCRAQVLAAEQDEQSGDILDALPTSNSPSMRALRYKASFGQALC